MTIVNDAHTSELAVEELRARMSGRLITPDQTEYAEARRVFFTGIDRLPLAIARVANASDVALVVSHARQAGLEVAVRSGGHSPAGHGVCDGGIVVDVSDLREFEVDVDRRTAWAGAGLTAADFTTAAGAHGLATGFGDTGSVGIGGITLAGGIGLLVRKYGLTIDALLAAQIVTADGHVLYVDDNSHSDLFWAIRGGGGNFGIATRFKFQLNDVDEIVGGFLMLPATPDVIRDFIVAAEAAPEELSAIANVVTAPPLPFVPAEHHGRPIIMAMLVHAGGGDSGERAVAPFRTLATPIADMLKPMRYPDIYALGEGPRPVAFAARPLFLESVERDTGEAIIEHLRRSTAPMRAAQLRVLGGAMARVPVDATAFAHRQRRVFVNIATAYERREEAAVHETWVGDLAAALPRTVSGTYVGFLGDEGEARVRDAYPGAIWDRLAAVKSRYDPTNLFRLNQNVRPAGANSPRE